MSAKYDVYGIGNALVDIEVEVSTDFLNKMEISKGLMTLVDQERQNLVFSKLEGNLHRRSCGGSAANTTIAVTQFGGKSFYSCKVANDEMGDFFVKDLTEHGLSSNLSQQERQSGQTGRCLVMITPDADRTMNTHLGITESFSVNEVIKDELTQSKYLYIEGYLVTSETGRAAAIQARKWAKEAGVNVAITFSDPGIVGHFKDGFLEIMGEEPIELLFCNELEAFAFTGEKDLTKTSETLKKYAKTFCITRGPKGAILYDGEKEIDILTQAVEAIDTNGAGDLFAGAFLYGVTNGLSFAESGRLACYSASELVTHFGARLPNEKIQEVKGRILGVK